ncbi:PAS-domain containing protein, partial [Hyphomicrobium sp.]|uniref:putative bifunctional diguanylate cyclase/phosphodiesterase n=1 Tax=Hyphomicrobium sp. TaxID=82 RepID=UPI001323777B
MLGALRRRVGSAPVRRLVGLLGAIVAVITALALPVGYGIIQYIKEAQTLAAKTDLTAFRAARFIQSSGSGWPGDLERLVEAIQVQSPPDRIVIQRIYDANDAPVAVRGVSAPSPTFSREVAIIVDGAKIGRAEVTGSLRPLLQEIGAVGLVGIGFGIAAYLAFAVLPLRALDRSLGELKEANEKLGRQNVILDTALDNMFQGLAMFDAEERLVFANDRYLEMYHTPPGEIVPGTTLRHIIELRIAQGFYAGSTVEQILGTMRNRVARGNISHITRTLADGRTVTVSIWPRADGGWVTTHQDITERETLHAQLREQHELLRQREEQLKIQNIHFDAALNNMSQGLAMFDGEQRLLVCNRTYLDMYGLTAEQVKPGMSSREILELRFAGGIYGNADRDKLIDGWLAAFGKDSTRVQVLADGRVINVCRRRLPHGGLVVTHQDITEQRRSEAKIVHMALHDQLTGLPNRMLLNERLEHALTRVKRGEIVALHLIDLDHFKTVNDTLGHPAGDKLLEMASERLHGLVRETDTIARMGGDEFAIVQVAISSPADATSLAHRLIEVVSEPYEIEGQQVIIGTSVGIAIGPQDGRNPDQLIRNADLALYRAKSDGRRTFCFFEPEMDAQMQQRRATEYDLRKALGAGEFELHYQPIVNLERNRISGCEALIRWRHPKKGLVLPGQFIPLAEEIGFIGPLSEWAVREACATAAKWPGELRIAVNLSPAQFRSSGLVPMITRSLAASGLAAERLELEITETALLDNGEATLATLYQLREVGVHIVMDDFGTG